MGGTAETETTNNGQQNGKEIPTIKNISVGQILEDKKEASTNFVLRLIQNHFRYEKQEKTEAEIESEKFLFPKLILVVPFNRWMTLPAAVVLQFCLGSLFAWSVFNKPIDSLIYGNDSHISVAPIAFYISCALLGVSSAFMGPWLEKNGPRRSCLLGTILFCLGHFLTALALHYRQMWLVIISYGIVSGFGSGICYISPISCLQKWFPDKRGLASGFAVCGFGAGSIVIAKIQLPLINSVGLPLTFATLGLIYFILMGLCSLVLRTPPPDFSVRGMRSDRSVIRKTSLDDNEKEMQSLNNGAEEAPGDMVDGKTTTMTLTEALLAKDFRLLYFVFFGSVIFGLCAISRLSNMVTDIFGRSAEEASTVVALNGGFNLAGRVIIPIVSDFVGRKLSYIILLTIQLLIIASFSFITSHGKYGLFVGSMWAISTCYGGASGTMPAFLTDKFGPLNVGACQGVIMTGWSLSGIAGGFIFTAIYDYALSKGYETTDAYPYNINSWWMCAIVFLGWISLVMVGPTEKDDKFRNKIRRFCK